MTDDQREDMRRRAARQASYGNYWAAKCVALLEQLDDMSCANCGGSGDDIFVAQGPA